MMKIAGLAYVVAETTDLNRWTSYAQEVLGMMTAPPKPYSMSKLEGQRM